MQIKKFNIRVYGILINEQNQVLITDELIKGNKITKFPGGGLEFGEGTIDCVKREFIEETNNHIDVTEHFYTTDYFQGSAYNKEHQIVSIYYMVKPVSVFEIITTEKTFDFVNDAEYAQTFRWLNLKDVSENDFTLPIDKIIGKRLNELSKVH